MPLLPNENLTVNVQVIPTSLYFDPIKIPAKSTSVSGASMHDNTRWEPISNKLQYATTRAALARHLHKIMLLIFTVVFNYMLESAVYFWTLVHLKFGLNNMFLLLF